MRKLFTILATAAISMEITLAQNHQDLPDSMYVGGQMMHVQGIAVDTTAKCFYLSFTDRFLKTDYSGKIIASIDRIQGHLGAMTFDSESRKIYASLECKDDEIGKGIASKLNVENVKTGNSSFYIAIIDVDAVDRPGIDPENDEVLKTVYLKDVARDYNAEMRIGNRTLKHRYGCSGVDGITIAPKIGSDSGKEYLYIAYGIYGDIGRQDNDYQVITRYDIRKIEAKARTIRFGELHRSGVNRPLDKYFVYTGNTRYGVQNMAYDKHSGNFYLAVYKGKKTSFCNFDTYIFSIFADMAKARLKEVGYDGKNHKIISKSGETIEGIRFKWGSTGICPIGEGYWYISENNKDKATGTESCTVRKYYFENNAFVSIEK